MADPITGLPAWADGILLVGSGALLQLVVSRLLTRSDASVSREELTRCLQPVHDELQRLRTEIREHEQRLDSNERERATRTDIEAVRASVHDVRGDLQTVEMRLRATMEVQMEKLAERIAKDVERLIAARGHP